MEPRKPKLFLPFSNPLLKFELPYEEYFRTSLIKECLNYKNQQDTINADAANRQVGWQSQKILFQTQEPCLKKISQYILSAVQSMSKSISPNIKLDDFNTASEGWININQQGSLHFPHTHGNTTFAGVFYVKVPEATKTTNHNNLIKQGFIEFLDPRNDVSSWACGIQEFRESTPFDQRMLLAPKEGVLLVFPGWLKHWVYPNIDNEERISISFNCKLVKKN